MTSHHDHVRAPRELPYEFGVPLASAMVRRERLARDHEIEYGHELVFTELVEALVREVPDGVDVLEVGAATGLITRSLLSRSRCLLALEPSEGMLKRLLASDVAAAPNLTIRHGMVEDLEVTATFDVAVVTFTPRRGLGLAMLVFELARRVRDRVVVLLDDDGALDWAYLARTAALRGLDVTVRIITGPLRSANPQERQRAVILIAEVERYCLLPEGMRGAPTLAIDEWSAYARDVEVPYPMPRGAATRVIRYMLAGGDRALRVVTDPEGAERLYGNLRTAVHRIARDMLTVRRDGSTIFIVRLPGGLESGTDSGE